MATSSFHPEPWFKEGKLRRASRALHVVASPSQNVADFRAQLVNDGLVVDEETSVYLKNMTLDYPDKVIIDATNQNFGIRTRKGTAASQVTALIPAGSYTFDGLSEACQKQFNQAGTEENMAGGWQVGWNSSTSRYQIKYASSTRRGPSDTSTASTGDFTYTKPRLQTTGANASTFTLNEGMAMQTGYTSLAFAAGKDVPSFTLAMRLDASDADTEVVKYTFTQDNATIANSTVTPEHYGVAQAPQAFHLAAGDTLWAIKIGGSMVLRRKPAGGAEADIDTMFLDPDRAGYDLTSPVLYMYMTASANGLDATLENTRDRFTSTVSAVVDGIERRFEVGPPESHSTELRAQLFALDDPPVNDSLGITVAGAVTPQLAPGIANSIAGVLGWDPTSPNIDSPAGRATVHQWIAPNAPSFSIKKNTQAAVFVHSPDLRVASLYAQSGQPTWDDILAKVPAIESVGTETHLSWSDPHPEAIPIAVHGRTNLTSLTFQLRNIQGSLIDNVPDGSTCSLELIFRNAPLS